MIAAPLWFNATFAVLGNRFDYPGILRRPTEEILERFRAGGPSLILLWWAFMLSGLLMIVAAVLLSQALGFGGVLPLAMAIGVLAGLVQMLGLLRWVFLVPSLARAYDDPQTSPAQREATVAIFRAFHQYLGVGVGEHLGYLLTGIWSMLIGVGVIQGAELPAWLGWPGIVRCRADTWLRGVSRAERRARMDTRRGGDPRPVHRVVPLAARPGKRLDRLIYSGLTGNRRDRCCEPLRYHQG